MRALPVTVGMRENTRGPGHTDVSVFVGRTRGSRAHAGEITLRTDEWDELRDRCGGDGDLVEVCSPFEQMFSHELQRDDVLDTGATITGDVTVDTDRHEVRAEVDHRHELAWPAYTIVKVYRPSEQRVRHG